MTADGSTILADCYLFGRNGQLIKDALDAGGSIGLSTVGFGDFLSDGITVDPNSYELERVGDFVLTPSAGVYGTADHQKPMDESKRTAARRRLERAVRAAKQCKKKTESRRRKPLTLSTPKPLTSKNPEVTVYLRQQAAHFPKLYEHRELLEGKWNIVDARRAVMKIKRGRR